MTTTLPTPVLPGIEWELHRPAGGRPYACAYYGDGECVRLHGGPLLRWRIAAWTRRLERILAAHRVPAGAA